MFLISDVILEDNPAHLNRNSRKYVKSSFREESLDDYQNEIDLEEGPSFREDKCNYSAKSSPESTNTQPNNPPDLRYNSMAQGFKNLWPGGLIPYTMSQYYNDKGRTAIFEAMRSFHRKTCVRFIPKRDNDENYVHFMPKSKCASKRGMVGSKQRIFLGPKCLDQPGNPEHEIMHALGFDHEHQRPDRDEFIAVNMDNIPPGAPRRYFRKKCDHMSALSHFDYRYDTLMHFSPEPFPFNGGAIKGPPFTAKKPVPGGSIGGQSLTLVDIWRINYLYCKGIYSSLS